MVLHKPGMQPQTAQFRAAVAPWGERMSAAKAVPMWRAEPWELQSQCHVARGIPKKTSACKQQQPGQGASELIVVCLIRNEATGRFFPSLNDRGY